MDWYLTLSGFINVCNNVYWYLQPDDYIESNNQIVVTLYNVEVTQFPKKSITCDDSRFFIYI